MAKLMVEEVEKVVSSRLKEQRRRVAASQAGWAVSRTNFTFGGECLADITGQ